MALNKFPKNNKFSPSSKSKVSSFMDSNCIPLGEQSQSFKNEEKIYEQKFFDDCLLANPKATTTNITNNNSNQNQSSNEQQIILNAKDIHIPNEINNNKDEKIRQINKFVTISNNNHHYKKISDKNSFLRKKTERETDIISEQNSTNDKKSNNDCILNTLNNKPLNKNDKIKDKIFLIEKKKKKKIPSHIFLYIFNYNEYKKKQSSYSYYYTYNYLFFQPSFVNLETIKNIKQIKCLWNGENSLLDNELIIDNFQEKEIYKDFLEFMNLENKKGFKYEGFRIDNMIDKFINFVIGESIGSVNNFEALENNQIEIFQKKLKSPNAEFYLALLNQELYSIVVNDVSGSNQKSNFQKIKKIIKEYNDGQQENLSLIILLCYKIEDCINYLLYIENDDNEIFKNKLVYFLKIQCNDIDESYKSDYILIYLLLCYNIKRVLIKRINNRKQIKNEPE